MDIAERFKSNPLLMPGDVKPSVRGAIVEDKNYDVQREITENGKTS